MAINLDHQQNRIYSDSKSVKFDQTGSLIIPVGTTSQRPSAPERGALRFNPTINRMELYNGTDWVNFNPLSSGETYITEGDAIAFAIALGS